MTVRFRLHPPLLAAALLAGAALHSAPAVLAATPARPFCTGAAGLVAGLDENGRLTVPDAAAIARLNAARGGPALAARPAPVHHPDGSISMNVRSWMREYSLARAAAGRPALGCAGHEATVPALSARPVARATGAEER